MLCGLGAGVALASTSLAPPYSRLAWVTAAVLILLRASANMLDGMVAVEFGRSSPTGDLYNEVPDRISDAAMLIGLGYAAGGVPWLGYAAACAALLVAYVRAVGKGAGAPQEFGGPMAKQRRMFTVVALGLYLGLSPHSWQPRWGSVPPAGLATVALAAILLGCLWTILWRLKRIASALQHRGA
jgi:phosphatidylglycerophosphate synthase